MRNILFYGGILLFVVWCVVRTVAYIQFGRDCEGYLKRAADANNIELARGELEKALKYIEYKSLTEGYTSILYTTPDEDLGFWYKNIKSAHEQLSKLDAETISDLEESNILMKLRETLCDVSDGKSSVTAPDGIYIYPNNTLWFWCCIIGLTFFVIGGIWKGSKGDFDA